jgi:hypothetical protein
MPPGVLERAKDSTSNSVVRVWQNPGRTGRMAETWQKHGRNMAETFNDSRKIMAMSA